ncbi:BppU family phage baseplate upper protein [Enterococcus mundtii]|uniref:BppU family phage baseplate upper protein n=1 Tax=Enterococcus mundtii TaxID=53346 RepID=UPI001EDC93F3|nr:BppU family phage baseplate upper protein [Enterococcus mundtii]
MVYKINESIIRIQAESLSHIPTNAVFWSYDKGTAKLRMQLLRKDNTPQILSEGTTVPIRLKFKSKTAKDGFGKHDYLASIEDRLGGIVSIVLEDNILGYVGTVEGSVYINFPDNRSLDTAGRFTFTIRRSPIDETTSELEDYYFNGFSQTIDKIEKIMTDGKQAIDQKIADSEQKINENLVETNNQITQVNQSIETLNHEITEANNRIDQTNQQISDLGNLKKMYSNSIDFGNYDYSGNHNLAITNSDTFKSGTGGPVTYANGEYTVHMDGSGRLSRYNVNPETSAYLKDKTQYTMSCEIYVGSDYTGDVTQIFANYAYTDGGYSILQTSRLPSDAPRNTWITVSGTSTIDYQGRVPKVLYFTWQTVSNTVNPTGTLKIRKLKIEHGADATPYQPNLLQEPYQVSKVALNNHLDTNGMTPVNTSNYLVYTYFPSEFIKKGSTFTIRLEGTKPNDKYFRFYMYKTKVDGTVVSNDFLGDMVQVEGLKNTWELVVNNYNFDDTDLTQRFRLYQHPNSNLGAVSIKWCKIEYGTVATPPITFYKYFGEGLKDSNTPHDYSWDVTPELTEKGLNDKVSLTKPQSIEGTKVFLDQPYIEGERISTEKFGISLTGGLLAGVPIAEWTALNWGSIFAYDNERSKTNDVFTISQDTKTLTILKNCTLQLAGTFTCQTDNSNFYAYLIILVNGANRYRLAGVAGGLNWRNDIGWIATRQFKAGDVLTLVTSTNVKSESISAWGVDQVYIREVITA